METPCLGRELRNLLLWLASACLSKDLCRKWAWPQNFHVYNTIIESTFNKSYICHCLASSKGCFNITHRNTEKVGGPDNGTRKPIDYIHINFVHHMCGDTPHLQVCMVHTNCTVPNFLPSVHAQGAKPSVVSLLWTQISSNLEI